VGSGPGSYKISYSVSLNNVSELHNKVFLALPVPPNIPNQVIRSGITFTPGYRKATENKFGNQIVFWEESLNGNSGKTWEEEFDIIVKPRKVIMNESWSLNHYKKANSLHLESNRHVNGEDGRIKGVAASLVDGEANLVSVSKRIYEYVVNSLEYGKPIEGLYSLEDALSGKPVDCGGFSSLLASLFRSVSVPSRIVSGFWADGRFSEASKKMHAWVEILLPNGEWFPLDPSVDYLRRHGRSKRVGGFGETGSDRIIFSFGSDLSIKADGREFNVDILQNPIVISDRGETSFERSASIIAK